MIAAAEPPGPAFPGDAFRLDLPHREPGLSLDDLAGSYQTFGALSQGAARTPARTLLSLSFDTLSGSAGDAGLTTVPEDVAEMTGSGDRRIDLLPRTGRGLLEDDAHGFGLDRTLDTSMNGQPLGGLPTRYSRALGGGLQARLSHRLFWHAEEGFGGSTRLDIAGRPVPAARLHWSASGLYSESTEGLEWRTGGDWVGRLSGRSALSFGVSAEGATRPDPTVDSYSTHLRFRSRLKRDGLAYEIGPELSWPRSEDYDLTPGISLRVKMPLGD